MAILSSIRTKSLAELRLLELGLSSPEEIDLEAIAWDEGVKIQYKYLSGCEARLVGYGDKAIATIKVDSDARRKRFSVAHELGHWNLHRGRSFECRVTDLGDSYTTKPSQEKEADAYASELLMPTYMFAPLASKIKRPTFDAVIELSEKFNTSITATAIRLAKVNVWPLIVVSHNKSGRNWFTKSGDVPDKWFPQNELSADSMAFDILHGGEKRLRAQKIPAESWFDRFDADRYDIIEDAIRIGSSQVLCLLWLEDDEMLIDVDSRKARY